MSGGSHVVGGPGGVIVTGGGTAAAAGGAAADGGGGSQPRVHDHQLGEIYECLKMDGGYMIYVYVYLYLRKYTHTHGFDKVMKIPPHYETNLLLFYQAPLLSLS